MPVSPFYIQKIIDIAAARLEPQVPGISISAELLKARVAQTCATLDMVDAPSDFGPLYEALIGDERLAKSMGVTLRKTTQETGPKQMAEVIRRDTKKGGKGLRLALHVSRDNTPYIFEFAEGPNLVKTATQIHTRRADATKDGIGPIIL